MQHALTIRFPNHGYGWKVLGSVLILEGKFAEAIETTQHAITLQPDDIVARCNLGRLFMQAGYLTDAMTQCQAALKITSHYPEAYALLGAIHTALGQGNEAVLAHTKALALDKKELSAHFDLGVEMMHRGKLPEAVAQFRQTLILGLDCKQFEKTTPKSQSFDSPQNARLLWKTMALLADAGVQAFATAGTLLGLEREGKLLAFDKDLDLGLPYKHMEQACQCLQANGWEEVANPMRILTPRAFKHKLMDIYLDLFGFMLEEEGGGKLVSGIWCADLPWEWQRITEFPKPLALYQVQHHYGKIWVLDNPSLWLETIYGDWRTPKPDFDTVISACNLRGFSLLTECFALLRINQSWRSGYLRKALSLTRQSLNHLPEDILLKQVAAHIESALTQPTHVTDTNEINSGLA